jgi:hypothetical protein
VTIKDLSNPAGVGFSTGVYGLLRGDWRALTQAVRLHNPQVAELSALSMDGLPSLVAYLRAHPEGVGQEYSVHAPSKGLGPDGLLLVQDDLLALTGLTSRIVIHPDIIGRGLDVLRTLGQAVVLENMDARKAHGQDVATLRALFGLLPQSRFCLDVAHAWSIDPSMVLAHALLDAFEDRLAQVHLSGIDSQGHHCSLAEGQLDAYSPVLARCHSVPWILESHLAEASHPPRPVPPTLLSSPD